MKMKSVAGIACYVKDINKTCLFKHQVPGVRVPHDFARDEIKCDRIVAHMIAEARGGVRLHLPLCEHKDILQTNWWVITGPPSSGKTTLLDTLRNLGYRVVCETARAVIDEAWAEGMEPEELRADERDFQSYVRRRQEFVEDNLDPGEVTFLDRALYVDGVAYSFLHSAHQPYDGIYYQYPQVPLTRRYAGVFMLDALPYEEDYARTESPEEVAEITVMLDAFCRIMHGESIRVPVLLSSDERAQFVLDYVRTAMPDMVEPSELQPRLI